ncbi:MAG TPA: ATP-binding cassette domain-containing protein [Parasegetibacter sp.]
MSYVIQTDRLSYRYSKDRKVLDDISLHIPRGSIYGFLGPNGAGKSTTMRLLTGIIPEQGNAIKLFGNPLKPQLPHVFERIGSLIEQPALYLHLSGINNLRYIAKLRGFPESKIPPVLELVGLAKDSKRKVRQYSLGMKQRLAIAMTLLSEPDLLLLDEPVNGLDPSGIQEIRQLLVRLNKERGVTIFISSHLLSEIEKMCTHIGIIHKGKLRYEGEMRAIASQLGEVSLQITMQNAGEWAVKLSIEHPSVVLENENTIRLNLNSREDIPQFSRNIIEGGANIYEIKMAGSLEDWFLSLTGNNDSIRQK